MVNESVLQLGTVTQTYICRIYTGMFYVCIYSKLHYVTVQYSMHVQQQDLTVSVYIYVGRPRIILLLCL